MPTEAFKRLEQPNNCKFSVLKLRFTTDEFKNQWYVINEEEPKVQSVSVLDWKLVYAVTW